MLRQLPQMMLRQLRTRAYGLSVMPAKSCSNGTGGSAGKPAAPPKPCKPHMAPMRRFPRGCRQRAQWGCRQRAQQ